LWHSNNTPGGIAMRWNVVHTKIGRELVKVVVIYTLVVGALAYVFYAFGW
jgi:hypothetical protein